MQKVDVTVLQSYADMICDDRNVRHTSVRIAASRARKYEYSSPGGVYYRHKNEITLYLPGENDLTRDGVRQTLLHELSHHFNSVSAPPHGRSFYRILGELMAEYGVTARALEWEKMAYKSFAYMLPSNIPQPYLYPPVLTGNTAGEIQLFVEYTRRYSERKFFQEYFLEFVDI